MPQIMRYISSHSCNLGVQGKTPQKDLLHLSHEYGLDIENKIRSDFEVLASRVEMGTVALDTTEKARKVFEKMFPNLSSQLQTP